MAVRGGGGGGGGGESSMLDFQLWKTVNHQIINDNNEFSISKC